MTIFAVCPNYSSSMLQEGQTQSDKSKTGGNSVDHKEGKNSSNATNGGHHSGSVNANGCIRGTNPNISSTTTGGASKKTNNKSQKNRNKKVTDSKDVQLKIPSEVVDDSSSNINFGLIILLLLFVAVVIVIVYFIINQAKKKINKENNRKINEMIRRMNSLETNFQQIDYLRSRVEKIEREYINNVKTATQKENSFQSPLINGEELSHSDGVSARAQRPQPTTLFLGPVGSNGCFETASTTRRYDSIFQLTSLDGHTGTFIVMEDENSRKTALQAVDALKRACKIDHPFISEPRMIRTLAEGHAFNENGHWHVGEKATVSFIE